MKFYQLPNSNLFTHHLLFSQEKPLLKPTAPGSSSCLAIYFSFAFLFRSIKPKNTKISCCTLFHLRSIISIYYNFLPSPCQFLAPYPKGIDNPFNTSGCEWLLFVCRGCLHSVAWFSYWFDTLVSLLREIPTVVVLHHPLLLGETLLANIISQLCLLCQFGGKIR